MTDRPTADELLAIARETVLEELLPQLPPAAHYAARMVANAIAIARRERHDAALPQPLVNELAELGGGSREAWAECVAQRIRARAFDHDPALAKRLVAALHQWTLLRVGISNPRLLEQPPA